MPSTLRPLQHSHLYNIIHKETAINRNNDATVFVITSPSYDVNNSFALTIRKKTLVYTAHIGQTLHMYLAYSILSRSSTSVTDTLRASGKHEVSAISSVNCRRRDGVGTKLLIGCFKVRTNMSGIRIVKELHLRTSSIC